MTLHHLDPDREPRECPGCADCRQNFTYYGFVSERRCNGTGRLGSEGEPDVETYEADGAFHFTTIDDGGTQRDDCSCSGDGFPTPDEALRAARCTHYGIVLSQHTRGWSAIPQGQHVKGSTLKGLRAFWDTDPDAALRTAIRAQRD